MKLISLSCNHCGAPLEVPKSARFVTCGYCNARLAIHQTGSSYSTELLEEIKATTETLVRDVERLKGDSALDRLDRQWDRQRSELLVTDEHGRQSVPSKTMSVFGSVLVGGFGIVWTVLAGSIFRPMALFGVIFVILALGSGFYAYDQAGKYARAKRRYHERRRKLIGERNEQIDHSNEISR